MIYLPIHRCMPSILHYSLKYIVGDTDRRTEIPSRASCSLDPRTKLGFMSKNLKDHPKRSHTLSDCTPFQALLPYYFDLSQLQRYRMSPGVLATNIFWMLRQLSHGDCHSVCAEASILPPFSQWKGGFWGRDENQAMFC